MASPQFDLASAQPVEETAQPNVAENKQDTKFDLSSAQPAEQTSGKPSMEQLSSGFMGGGALDNIAVNAVIAPLAEVERGLLAGSESIYNKMDALTKLGAKIIGQEAPTVFKDWSNSLKQERENLPQTEMAGPIKFVYQALGQAPSAIGEFTALKGLGSGALSNAAKFGTLEALNEFSKDDDLKSLISGFSKGLVTGMAFESAGKLANIAYSISKEGLKKVIAFNTGDMDLATDFVNNLRKYTVNPFKKVTSSEAFRKESAGKLRDIKKMYSEQEFNLTREIEEANALRNQKTKDSIEGLRETNKSAEEALKNNQSTSVATMAKNVDESVANIKQAQEEHIVGVFDGALKKYGAVKETMEKEVNGAVEKILELDPLVSVNGTNILKQSSDLVKKSQILKDAKGNLSTTSLGNPADTKILQGVLEDIKIRTESKDLSVGYLRQLKADAEVQAGKYFKSGNNTLGRVYSDLADIVNPIKHADDFVASAPGMRQAIYDLKLANKEYSTKVGPYKEAMEKYFQRDADGVLIPNIKNAINAVKNNDQVAIRQLMKADSVLPEGDRILPQIKTLIENEQTAIGVQKKSLEILKARNEAELKIAQDAHKKSMQELSRNEGKLSREEKRSLQEKQHNFKVQKSNDISSITSKIDSMAEQLSRQEILRGPMAQGQVSRPAQRWSAYLNLAGPVGSLLGVGSGTSAISPVLLGATVGMSPSISSNATKGILNTLDLGRKVASKSTAQGGYLIKQLLSKKSE